MRERECSVAANWTWISISIVVFVGLMLAVLYLPEIREFDIKILHDIRAFLAPYPSYIPLFIADFGIADNFIWPQITVCAVLISNCRYIKAFLLVFFTQATIAISFAIKDFVCRPRPEGANHIGYSFPSLHSSEAMCLYGIVVYLIMHYVRNTFWRYFLTVFFSLYILLVATSRLWKGVHFLTDVTAGLFLGLIFVNLFIILCKKLHY